MNTFAVAYKGNYAVYGARNKVYKLFYTMNDVAEKLWEAPSDKEEITCIELQKFSLAAYMNMGIMPNVRYFTWLHGMTTVRKENFISLK